MAGNHHPGLGGVTEVEGFPIQLNMFLQVPFTLINKLIQKPLLLGPCAVVGKHVLKVRLRLVNILLTPSLTLSEYFL